MRHNAIHSPARLEALAKVPASFTVRVVSTLFGISTNTAAQWIRRMVLIGRLVRVAFGKYRVSK
jgi:predicted transcriptional regulator of viral defense system